MTNVVIVSAARTAVGSFNGSFANVPAHELGASVLEAVVARAGIEKGEVSEYDEDYITSRDHQITAQAKAALKRAAERRDPPDVALSSTLTAIGLW